ncbi:MAG: FAD-dependent oxidoreductase, partial [Thermoleophilia bacterium]
MGNSVAGTSRGRPSVAVVGAGVSGCAAALALARAGVQVVLLNSALDSLGLPGYGPVVDYSWFVGPEGAEGCSHAGGGFAPLLRTVAPGLAGAWLAHAWDCEGGATLALVDRRAVSLAVKWKIENEPLIDIRQGIVTGIEEPDAGASRGRGAGAVELTTAFGEQVVADAVVVAVGLALGGRVRVGAQVSTGGRLGETGSEELLECLRRRSVSFDQVGVSVGASFSMPAEWDSGRRGRAPQRPRFPDLSGLGLSQVEFVPTDGGRSEEEDGWT